MTPTHLEIHSDRYQPTWPSRLLGFLMGFLLLCLSGGWIVNVATGQTKAAFYVILLIVGTSVFLIKGRIYLPKYSLFLAVILSVTLLLLGTIHGDIGVIVPVVLKVAVALLCLCAFSTLSQNPIELISRIIYLSVFISVPLYLASLFAPSILSPVPHALIDTGGRPLKYLTAFGVNYHMVTLSQETALNLRNQFIFWEPGVYAAFINIAIFYYIKIGLGQARRLIPLYIGLISTGSIGGAFINLLLLAALQAENARRWMWLLIGGGSLLVAATWFFLGDILAAVADAVHLIFGRDLADDASVSSRSHHMVVPFLVAWENPAWGVGYQSTEQYETALRGMYNKSSVVISNSIAQLAYYFGFPALLGYVYLLWRACVSSRMGVSFFLLLMLTLAHEPVYLAPFMFLIIFNRTSLLRRTTE